MDVSSSFHYTPRNASGNIQNGIVVLDEVANTAQTITAVEKMDAMDIGNNSANYLRVGVTLEDDQGITSNVEIFMFPGSSESWSFGGGSTEQGRFITEITIVACDKPTATAQNSSGLIAAAVAAPGIVDVNLLES